MVFVLSSIFIVVSLVDNNVANDDCAEVTVMIFSVDRAASAVVSMVLEWLVGVLTSSYVEVSNDEAVLEKW